MKNKIYIVLSMFLCLHLIAVAQENVNVTKQLEGKYERVKFDEIISGASKDEPRDYYYRVYNYDGKAGACNSQGKEIVPTKYSYVSLERTFDKPYRYFYYVKLDDTHSGLYSEDGKLIIKPQYDFVMAVAPENGCFHVERNGKYGLVEEKTGKEIVAPMWGFVSFKDDYINVCNGKIGAEGTTRGILDKTGKKWIIPCEYDWIRFEERTKLFELKKGNMFGYADNTGKLILPCKCSNVIDVYDSLGVIIYSKGGIKNSRGWGVNWPALHAKWGMIDLQGNEIAPCEYDYIGSYSDSLFLFNKGGDIAEEVSPTGNAPLPSGGKFGYMDVKGNEIIPCQYEVATQFEKGVAHVMLNGVSSVIANPLTGTSLNIVNGNSSSKVDTNIPNSGRNADNTFAFIIANENYSHLSGGDFSINDGKVFAEYCKKTLGVPEKNVRYYEDATFGNIVNAMQKIKDIADVYDGDAQIILYYSGLGTTDKLKERYILPVDATLDALETTGYKVQNIMNALNELNTTATIVIMDAPFSGADKSGKMLAQHRGVQISPKSMTAKGNTILCFSSDMSETARSDNKYGHSLFTYSLLEKLQQSKGTCTVKESIEYAVQQTKKKSLEEYDASQTPNVGVGEKIRQKYNTLKW
ncbi:MAG: WG repeat-containing protein [Prevotella sp.]|nr:WG repeat-containing protein [Prevotella sp.]